MNKVFSSKSLTLCGKALLFLLVLALNVALRASPGFLPIGWGKSEKDVQAIQKTFQDENGKTFFLEYDPYHWMRYAVNTINKGHPGDLIKDGVAYDTFMSYPAGTAVGKQRFLFYFTAYSYKFLNFFYKDLKQNSFIFYFPVFISVLFLLLLYLFVYNLSKNYFCALLSMLTVGMSHFVLLRTSAGWYDMDGLAILFMLALVWFASHVKNHKSIFPLLSMLACATIYAFTWQGWWFSLVIATIIIFLNLYLDNDLTNVLKRHTIKIGLCFVGLIVGLELIFWFVEKKEFFYYLINFIFNMPVWDNLDVGPNGLSFTVELNKTNLSNLVSAQYGWFVFILSIISTVYTCFMHKNRRLRLVFLVWIIATTIALLKSYRFGLFWVVPVNIAVAISLTDFIRLIQQKTKNIIAYPLVCLILCSVAYPIYRSAINDALYCVPLIKRPMYDALKFIDNNTSPSSAVLAWWDYGDWIKSIANRPVFVDGQTQDGPMTYWVAKYFISSDVRYSTNLSRWLMNGAVEIIYLLDQFTGGRYQTIALVEKLLNANSEEGRIIIDSLSGPEPYVKRQIHGSFYWEPKHDLYLLVPQDLVNYYHTIQSIGNWVFGAEYIIKNKNKAKDVLLGELVDVFGVSYERALRLYNYLESNRFDKKHLFITSDNQDLFQETVLYKLLTNSFEHWQGYKLVYSSNGVHVYKVPSFN